MAPNAVKFWLPGTSLVVTDSRGGDKTKGTMKLAQNTWWYSLFSHHWVDIPACCFGAFCSFFLTTARTEGKCCFSVKEHGLFAGIQHSWAENTVSLLSSLISWKCTFSLSNQILWLFLSTFSSKYIYDDIFKLFFLGKATMKSMIQPKYDTKTKTRTTVRRLQKLPCSHVTEMAEFKHFKYLRWLDFMGKQTNLWKLNTNKLKSEQLTAQICTQAAECSPSTSGKHFYVGSFIISNNKHT